jgi:hypothetical protein
MHSVTLLALCIHRTKRYTVAPTRSYDGTIQGVVLVVKPAGHRLHVVTVGGRNYKLDANVEWISFGSIMTSLLLIPNSWLLWHQRPNAVKVHCLFRHLNTRHLLSLCNILVNNQLDAFFQCIYFTSLHVSSHPVLIVRRINYINTSSGIYHSGR